METILNLEEENHKAIFGRETDITALNLPKSNEFVTNSRNQRIHVRTYLPSSVPVGLVIFIHGYSAHVNRPMYPLFAREINKENYGFITFDFHGHGYSEGINKALIENGEHLLDDVRSVLQALYSPSEGLRPYYLNSSGFKCPFVLVGQSMGGAVNIAISLEMMKSDTEDPIAMWYRGSILNCPALTVNKPSALVLYVFEYILLPLIPHQSVPSFMNSHLPLSESWVDPSMPIYIHADGDQNNPNSISFGDPIRYQTAYSLLRFFEKVESQLSSVSFPFVVLHDEEDKVVPVRGSKRLMEVSKTPDEDKQFVVMPGGKHDLFHNRGTTVLRTILSFCEKYVENSKNITIDISDDKEQ